MDLRCSGAALRLPVSPRTIAPEITGAISQDTYGFNRRFLLQAQKEVILGAVQQSQSLYLRRH
jgi:hypothetical protein